MEILTSLALLACPVGMGVMMWFMMKGSKPDAAHPRSVEQLGEEQRRIALELERRGQPNRQHTSVL